MRLRRSFAVLAASSALLAACGGSGSVTPGTTDGTTEPGTTGAPAEALTIGMILVGPKDDHGWSQAHYEGGQWVAEQLGAELIVVDKVNPADSPESTVEQVAEDMVAQGADLVIATSDDMKDGILLAAAAHPDVPMVWSSGDSAWTDGQDFRDDLTNLSNVMGRMEIGKFIAGCAAGARTQTGHVGYVGPLINAETRRLASSAYLGAKHCYTGEGELEFDVTWIGFWFNIPGVTLDPTQVVNDFLDSGADVVMSGIDTTEAVVRTGQRAAAGEEVWAVAYDFEDGCAEASDICLGVPYFNWRPSYLALATSVQDGTYEAGFSWTGPDWSDLTGDASAIGWAFGNGLTEDQVASVQAVIDELAAGTLDVFVGPLDYQDGSAFLADGETATDVQVWYLDQLLAGMSGASA